MFIYIFMCTKKTMRARKIRALKQAVQKREETFDANVKSLADDFNLSAEALKDALVAKTDVALNCLGGVSQVRLKFFESSDAFVVTNDVGRHNYYINQDGSISNLDIAAKAASSLIF